MGEAIVIAAVREFANRFLGRGDATITVPSFDGALKPNQKLESAETLLTCEAPEDLATDGRNLFIADGQRLLSLNDGTASEVRSFERPISALCALPGGGLAVALGGREVRLYASPSAEQPSVTFADGAFNAVNALTLASDNALIASGAATASVSRVKTTGAEWPLRPALRCNRIMAGNPSMGGRITRNFR